MLRQKIPIDEHVYFGHKATIDILPFLFAPTITALKQPRQLMFITDSIVRGKRLEAGVLMSQLMRRRKGKRILALAVKLYSKKTCGVVFSIQLTRLDSAGLNVFVIKYCSVVVNLTT